MLKVRRNEWGRQFYSHHTAAASYKDISLEGRVVFPLTLAEVDGQTYNVPQDMNEVRNDGMVSM